MKKILFGLAALSAMAFGADEVIPSPSTGVHTTRGSNQIDVETRAFIINSGLVITASKGTENDTISDAIKKAVLDHGTLMAGTSKISEVSKTVYVRRTDSKNFPNGTAINIELKHTPPTNGVLNKLKYGEATATDKNTIPHTLTAAVTNATFNNGNNMALIDNTLRIFDKRTSHAGDFVVGEDINNIGVTLKSRIEAQATSALHEEGEYTNTSTLAVKFSKVPQGSVNTNHELATLTSGVPTPPVGDSI